MATTRVKRMPSRVRPVDPVVGVRWMIGVAAVAISLGWVYGVSRPTLHGVASGILRQFDYNARGTIPQWYLSSLFLAGAGLSWEVWRRERMLVLALRRYWLGLTVLFAYLSLDEFTGYHQDSNWLVHRISYFGWFVQEAWVLLALVLAVLFAIGYFPFLRRLPRVTARRLMVAGALFVVGALGFEAVGAFTDTHGFAAVVNVSISGVETGLEMLGAILFVHTVWRHLIEMGFGPLYWAGAARREDGSAVDA